MCVLLLSAITTQPQVHSDIPVCRAQPCVGLVLSTSRQHSRLGLVLDLLILGLLLLSHNSAPSASQHVVAAQPCAGLAPAMILLLSHNSAPGASRHVVAAQLCAGLASCEGEATSLHRTAAAAATSLHRTAAAAPAAAVQKAACCSCCCCWVFRAKKKNYDR